MAESLRKNQAGEGILGLGEPHRVEIKELLADDSLASEQKFEKVPF